MLFIAGVVHLLPLSGVLGGGQLASLYGIGFDEPNLAILMRHRAVLFGLVGGLMLWSVFKPALRSAAIAGGLVSVASFLHLASAVGNYNARIERVFTVDIALLACLVAAAIAHVATLRVARASIQK